MKRSRLGSALAGPALPVVFAFVLTARPARLYAESAPYYECGQSDFVACEGRAHGETCASASSAPHFCQPAACHGDGGDFITDVLRCAPEPMCWTAAAEAACSGKSVGDTCTNGTCGQADCYRADGGPTRALVCKEGTIDAAAPPPTTTPTPGTIIPAAEAGTPSAAADETDGGCAVAASPADVPFAGLASLGGLALAVAAFVRRIRRR